MSVSQLLTSMGCYSIITIGSAVALSCSDEVICLVLWALVYCCSADQVELQKDFCQSSDDIIVTSYFLNVSNSVLYKNSYGNGLCLFRGDDHSKKK